MDYTEELLKLRSEINAVDKELVSLFQKRMIISERIGEVKTANKLRLTDENREREVIEAALEMVSDDNKSLTELFMRCLITQSKAKQRMKLRACGEGCAAKSLHVGIQGHEYDIYIGRGILNNLLDMLGGLLDYKGKCAAIISDTNVFPLYGDRVAKLLKVGGIEAREVVIPAGERSKSQACLETVYDKLLDMGITRSGLIIALGGGMVGDLAGYAAATFLRGVSFIQIPTTLLAQVDSSVGGKVAINHSRGKNLIGAFYQPRLVLADTECLDTLDKRFLADGMGEVIKYGAIKDEGLFELLELGYNNLQSRAQKNQNAVNAGETDMVEIVARCCDIKRRIVECDEHEHGIRMILNFGHTFGHAIERFYNFERYTHGEAVSIGMVLACELGERLGVTEPGTSARISGLLIKYGLPVLFEENLSMLFNLLLLDKKRDGEILSCILLDRIGSCKIHRIEISKIKEVML